MRGSGGVRAGWLFGPVPDLLFGCGGLYLCALLAFAIGGAGLRDAEAGMHWLGPLLVLMIGAPHYGATILRVYEQRADRRAYVFFAVHATLVIAGAFVFGLYQRPVAVFLITLYLTWSPWHYTGQNYGLAVMFLRRAGVGIEPVAKRCLYASFLLSFATTVLIFHGSGSAPDPEFASGPPEYFASIGIPDAITGVAFPLCFGGSLLALAYAGLRFRRAGASWRALGPAVALAGLQSLWFTLPFALRHWGADVSAEPLRWSERTYYFFWIAIGHSIQYIWITSYYARRSEHWPAHGGGLRYFAKILIAGTAVWTFPVILFDPSRFGVLPNTAALSLLVAAAVNLHHFVLDGAIWKLRQGRIADVLVRRPKEADAITPRTAERGFGRRLVWTIGVCASALAFFRYVNLDVLFPMAVESRDFGAARSVLQRLRWVTAVNEQAAQQLDAGEARYEGRQRAYERRAERRLGVIPSVAPHLRRAADHVAKEEWAAALEDYEAGLRLDPSNGALLRGAGSAWLARAEPQRAAELFERALELYPWDEVSRQGLQQARRQLRAGQPAY
jgi:hypothetical protein